jgi:hypothetical protein
MRSAADCRAVNAVRREWPIWLDTIKEAKMDIGRSFTYVTEDEEWWKKVLIGALLTLIPVVGQFYGLGYMLATLKNVIEGRETPLPEVLEDFGGKIVKGLLISVIIFVYMLPLIIVSSCAGGGGAAFPELLDDEDTAGIIAAVWGGCFGCLSLLYGIVVSLFIPFVMAIYAETGQFGEAFKLGKIFAMLKSAIGPTIVALLVSALAGFVAGIAGSILCGIGIIATAFYAQLINAFLFGSLYNQARQAVV